MTQAQDLSVTMNGTDEWIARYHSLEFKLSRELTAGERLGVIVGTTDVSDLCAVRGDTLIYQPETLPLPSGSHTVSIFLIAPDGEWTSAGEFPLHILTILGVEKMFVTPSFTLTNKGQLAEDHAPEQNGPPRRRFQELNGALDVKAGFERVGIGTSLSFNMVGASFRQDALRFAERHEDAPKIDLAGYQMEAHTGQTSLAVGHFGHGRYRHLLDGFQSRGISAGTAIGSFLDVSAAVVNATNPVGWNNFLGLHDARHRIMGGTLGIDAFPELPGAIRVELSYVQGSQLPINGANEALINDAEESNGGAVRVLLSDPTRRVTMDAGFSRTRFTNPVDPLLSQEFTVVPVEPTTRQARYAEFGLDVFRDASITPMLPSRLSVAFRHERVDPLYRAVGVTARPDILQNVFELHGAVGPLQCDVTYLESEDNLADIPSVLKTKTRQVGGNLRLSPSSSLGLLPAWLPALTYALNRTHQFGVSTPANSDFTPARVPDQVTTSHSAGIEWQSRQLTLAYRGAFTVQDNRQQERENADILNRAHAVNVTLLPVAELSLNLDGAFESTENTDIGALIRITRLGASLLARPLRTSTVTASGSLSISKAADGSSSQRQAFFSIETAYAFDFSSALVFNWRGQVFVRFSWNDSKTEDHTFGVDVYQRAWTVNTGVSFNIF
ncbi:MAG: hypothetical protein AB1428_07210 [Bacteroidota bacterium]